MDDERGAGKYSFIARYQSKRSIGPAFLVKLDVIDMNDIVANFALYDFVCGVTT